MLVVYWQYTVVIHIIDWSNGDLVIELGFYSWSPHLGIMTKGDFAYNRLHH